MEKKKKLFIFFTTEKWTWKQGWKIVFSSYFLFSLSLFLLFYIRSALLCCIKHNICYIQMFIYYRCQHTAGVLLTFVIYQLEGRGFDSQRCHWDFFIEIILPTALWPWSWISLFNRNEYQGHFLKDKGGRRVWLTNIPWILYDPSRCVVSIYYNKSPVNKHNNIFR